MKGPIRSLVVLIVVAATGILAVSRGQEQPGRVEFMRAKLGHSKDILEGLAREDYAMIGKGARALKEMRESRDWAALNRPEAGRYEVYSRELQEVTEDLVAKAKEKNLDGATLAYLRLTVNCVNCHKEIRSERK
jgi:hypothetical protein